MISNDMVKKKNGFTLIELIIVIAIIAILAAIAIPNFLSIQRKAKVNADIATGKTIFDATTTLVAENKLEMPKHQITEDGERFGYSLSLVKGTTDKNAIELEKLLQQVPVSQSIKDGYFVVNVAFDYGSDGYNLDKPVITVILIDPNDKKDPNRGEIYPSQSEFFKTN